MHGFVFASDLLETIRCGPFAVGRCQDCLVWEGACTTFPQGGERLVQSVVAEETEDEQRSGELVPLIVPFSGRDVLYSCQCAKGLVIVFGPDSAKPHMEREQRHLYLHQVLFFRWVKK